MLVGGGGGGGGGGVCRTLGTPGLHAIPWERGKRERVLRGDDKVHMRQYLLSQQAENLLMKFSS